MKTETKLEAVGQFFNADVMEEAKQKIRVLRENLTSYMATIFLRDQTKDSLRNGLIILLSRLRLGPCSTVRVDPHSSIAA